MEDTTKTSTNEAAVETTVSDQGAGTALVPANKETKVAKKNKTAEDKAPVAENRKLHFGGVDELLIPTAKNGAPEWLIKAHGDRVTSQLVDGLIESVKDDGIKKPLEVWSDRGKKWILDGVQRFRALLDANKMLVAEGKAPRSAPYFEVQKGLSSSELFALTMKLNGFVKVDTPLQKAEKASALYQLARQEGKNDTQAQRLVADALGNISPAMVHNYLVMNTASPKLKKMVADGKVAASVVMELAHLPQAEQELALEEAAKNSGKKDKDGNAVPTTTSAKSVVKARTGKYSEKEPIDGAGVKRIIKEHIEGDLSEIAPEHLRILRFAMGQISAEDVHVKGFTASVRFISGK